MENTKYDMDTFGYFKRYSVSINVNAISSASGH